MGSPAVSIVMPVHNHARYLDESLASLVGQSFGDFEIVVLDDASTDGSAEMMERWAARDDRIRVHRASHQLGLVGSSNLVAGHAVAPLVARMDADDVAHPRRIERQWELFSQHPDVVLVGSLAEGIDGCGSTIRPRDRARCLKPAPFSPFPHGSAMFRRDAFVASGGYRPEAVGWEELDLFLRLAERGRVLVLLEPLHRTRYHAGSATVTASDEQQGRASTRRRVCLAAYRAGADYSGLLRDPPDGDGGSGLLEAVASRVALQVWAGNRPSPVPRPGVLRRPRPAAAVVRVVVFGWAGWVSPRLLRSLLRPWISARDLAAARSLRHRRVVEWRFGRS